MCMEYPIIGIEMKAKYYFRNHNLILGNGYLEGKIKQIIMHHCLKGLPTLQAPLVQSVKT